MTMTSAPRKLALPTEPALGTTLTVRPYSLLTSASIPSVTNSLDASTYQSQPTATTKTTAPSTGAITSPVASTPTSLVTTIILAQTTFAILSMDAAPSPGLAAPTYPATLLSVTPLLASADFVLFLAHQNFLLWLSEQVSEQQL